MSGLSFGQMICQFIPCIASMSGNVFDDEPLVSQSGSKGLKHASEKDKCGMIVMAVGAT